MGDLPNNLLKKSELTTALCAPGVVAEALEQLMRGDVAQAEFAACVRCDPVLAVRLRRLPADFSLVQPDLARRERPKRPTRRVGGSRSPSRI